MPKSNGWIAKLIVKKAAIKSSIVPVKMLDLFEDFIVPLSDNKKKFLVF